jgi:hypothetical protein
MHAVVRSYSGQGASEVFDLIGDQEDEVRELISGVPGFVSYTAIREGDGGVTVTMCDDKAGTDESSRRAAEFIKDRLTASAAAPDIVEGDTFIQFSA